jgi:hypothetical protein
MTLLNVFQSTEVPKNNITFTYTYTFRILCSCRRWGGFLEATKGSERNKQTNMQEHGKCKCKQNL